jgi:hypothetical protein
LGIVVGIGGVDVEGDGNVRGMNSLRVGLRTWVDWDVFVVIVVVLCMEDERDDGVEPDVEEQSMDSLGGTVGVEGFLVVF